MAEGLAEVWQSLRLGRYHEVCLAASARQLADQACFSLPLHSRRHIAPCDPSGRKLDASSRSCRPPVLSSFTDRIGRILQEPTKFAIVERYEQESSQQYHLNNPVSLLILLG